MVPPKKPEWFQLTEGEGHNRPIRRRRFIKIAALTAPLVIVAGGALVAQTGDSGPTNAVLQTPTPAISKVISNEVSPNPVKATPAQTTNFVKKSAIANPPTKRGDEGEWEDD